MTLHIAVCHGCVQQFVALAQLSWCSSTLQDLCNTPKIADKLRSCIYDIQYKRQVKCSENFPPCTLQEVLAFEALLSGFPDVAGQWCIALSIFMAVGNMN